MAKYFNKPYVWADLSGSAPILHIRFWSDDDLGISTEDGWYRAEEHEDAYVVIFTKTSVAEEMMAEGCKRVLDIGRIVMPAYDQRVHRKVTVLIESEDRDILGFQTITPALAQFSCESSVPTMRPYLWMQFISTTDSVVHVAAEVTETSGLSESEPFDEPDFFRRTVTYAVDPGSSASEGIIHDDHNLSEGEYDPVMDNIIIRLVQYDSSGVEKKKGSGTTHTSQGDASGGG